MLVELKHCTKLEYLDISLTGGYYADRLDELFACLPLLRTIMLNRILIEDRDLHSLAHHCPLLEYVTLYDTMQFTLEGLSEMLKQAHCLTRLDVDVHYKERLENQQWLTYRKQRHPHLKISYF